MGDNSIYFRFQEISPKTLKYLVNFLSISNVLIVITMYPALKRSSDALLSTYKCLSASYYCQANQTITQNVHRFELHY